VRRPPAVFAPPKLDAHHPGQGLGRRASSCHAKPEDYDEMRCAEMMWSRASTKVCGSCCDRARTPGPAQERS
jgi:hypothetical protein